MLKTLEWIGLHDGYGIVGWAWECPYCNHQHEFCYTDEDVIECGECHKESINLGDPDD